VVVAEAPTRSHPAVCMPEPSRAVPTGHRDDVEHMMWSKPPAVFDRPVYELPKSCGRRLVVCPSVMRQADGIAHSVLGVRLERDVMAQSSEESYCTMYGLPDFGVPLGGFDGLYFAHFDVMPAVVATVASHHGRGAFIVPERSFDGPSIGRVFGKPNYRGSGSFCRGRS
jgi:hypothetical protein